VGTEALATALALGRSISREAALLFKWTLAGVDVAKVLGESEVPSVQIERLMGAFVRVAGGWPGDLVEPSPEGTSTHRRVAAFGALIALLDEKRPDPHVLDACRRALGAGGPTFFSGVRGALFGDRHRRHEEAVFPRRWRTEKVPNSEKLKHLERVVEHSRAHKLRIDAFAAEMGKMNDPLAAAELVVRAERDGLYAPLGGYDPAHSRLADAVGLAQVRLAVMGCGKGIEDMHPGLDESIAKAETAENREALITMKEYSELGLQFSKIHPPPFAHITAKLCAAVDFARSCQPAPKAPALPAIAGAVALLAQPVAPAAPTPPASTMRKPIEPTAKRERLIVDKLRSAAGKRVSEAALDDLLEAHKLKRTARAAIGRLRKLRHWPIEGGTDHLGYCLPK